MVTSGRKFFGQFWCDAVGGRNVAEGVAAENSNAVINMEQVYEWNPDIIFITNFTPVQPEDLYENAVGQDDWSPVKAVQDKQVYKLPLGTYRSYTPSTDTPMTLLWMAKQVYPDLFPDVDITREVKNYYEEMYGVELSSQHHIAGGGGYACLAERTLSPDAALSHGCLLYTSDAADD